MPQDTGFEYDLAQTITRPTVFEYWRAERETFAQNRAIAQRPRTEIDPAISGFNPPKSGPPKSGPSNSGPLFSRQSTSLATSLATSLETSGSTAAPTSQPGPSSVVNDQTIYSSAELLKLFSGNTVYGGLNEREGQWVEYMSDDGRSIYRNRHGELLDGNWWVSGNKLCFAYGSQKRVLCHFVVNRNGRLQFISPNGHRESYATRVVKGDGEKLIEAVLLRRRAGF